MEFSRPCPELEQLVVRYIHPEEEHDHPYSVVPTQCQNCFTVLAKSAQPRHPLDHCHYWSSHCHPPCIGTHPSLSARRRTPVGTGALDETFDMAFETEQATAAGVLQAGVFLDCSKCYERIPLHKLEQFALERGYSLLKALYALYVLRDIYSGRRRVLIQVAVSLPVTASYGMPLGCGHAVDLLHALQSAGRPETGYRPQIS
eukprot:2625169-Amphidinium_carterae.1